MRERRRIIDDRLYAHFVTLSVYNGRRLLDHEYPKRILLGVLGEELKQHLAACVGFVVMPDHAHAIVSFSQTETLSKFMHGWKRKSSFHIRNWCRNEAPQYFMGFGEGDKFWQPKYYSFEIYNRSKLEEKLLYMHTNPVRAGLAQKATDWKWSSARWYEWRKSVGVPITWVEC
jgi:putative transposase